MSSSHECYLTANSRKPKPALEVRTVPRYNVNFTSVSCVIRHTGPRALELLLRQDNVVDTDDGVPIRIKDNVSHRKGQGMGGGVKPVAD